MKQLTGISLVLFLLVSFMGCNDQVSNPVSFSQDQAVMVENDQPVQQFSDDFRFLFGAVLLPLNVVKDYPNANNYGQSQFMFDMDLGKMEYSVTVFDMKIVESAYICYEVQDGNLEAVAKLYPLKGDLGVNTVKGTINGDKLFGPLEGGTLEDLLEAADLGLTHIIVSTGDFAPGKIGGKIKLQR